MFNQTAWKGKEMKAYPAIFIGIFAIVIGLTLIGVAIFTDPPTVEIPKSVIDHWKIGTVYQNEVIDHTAIIAVNKDGERIDYVLCDSVSVPQMQAYCDTLNARLKGKQ